MLPRSTFSKTETGALDVSDDPLSPTHLDQLSRLWNTAREPSKELRRFNIRGHTFS